MDFKKAISQNKESIIKSIQESVRINSVLDEAKPGMPFGEGPAKALKHILDLGESFGFKCENFDNYAGHIDFGEGSDTLGILGHIDVVPAGEGWICDPYSGEIIDGRLYGRGVIDDKGPMIACLYAMKILKDLNIPLSKKIRMIIGANEETNWDCVDHYFNKLNMPHPDIAFTPDAEFPVTFAEKGIVQCTINCSIDNNYNLKGGSAFNSVPEFAEITLDEKHFEDVKKAIKETENIMPCKCSVEKVNNKILIKVQGKAAHTARLEGGCNAISCLMNILSYLKLEGDLKKVCEFYNKNIGLEIYGEKMKLAVDDGVSGKLTLNVGMVNQESGKVSFSIDIRIPVLISTEHIKNKIIEVIEEKGLSVDFDYITEPLYVEKDSFLVQTLMNVYKDVTGDTDCEPLVDGAATYARACNNCVAFGALLKDQENLMHYKNENVEVEKILIWLEIYLEAIYRLAK